MKTNIEKWNYYLSMINDKFSIFFEEQKKGKTIPESYWYIYPSGKVVERTILEVKYSYHKHNVQTWYSGKSPKTAVIQQLKTFALSNIVFDIQNIYYTYSEPFGDGFKSTSLVKYLDIINQKNFYLTKDDADKVAIEIIEKTNAKKAFLELHKKDTNYNYSANGYKFLGWQNGWQHECYDEDGKLCSESGKPKKTFGYPKERYPEYAKCLELGHIKIEVSHSRSGAENVVSCPICKIMYKYDCSG